MSPILSPFHLIPTRVRWAATSLAQLVGGEGVRRWRRSWVTFSSTATPLPLNVSRMVAGRGLCVTDRGEPAPPSWWRGWAALHLPQRLHGPNRLCRQQNRTNSVLLCQWGQKGRRGMVYLQAFHAISLPQSQHPPETLRYITAPLPPPSQPSAMHHAPLQTVPATHRRHAPCGSLH